jgi:hypothetical protein
LAATDLPIHELPAGTALYRIHRLAHGPIFFGPGPGNLPTYRFDSLNGSFGVFYAALSLTAALVETVSRNPARKMVAYDEIAIRASTVLHSSRDLRLVRLYGTGLQQVGCDNAISTGPYDPCGAWADALWAHRLAPDGIAYQSRHDSGEICLALFERPSLALIAGPTIPLLEQLPAVANILSIHGKSVTGLPP